MKNEREYKQVATLVRSRGDTAGVISEAIQWAAKRHGMSAAKVHRGSARRDGRILDARRQAVRLLIKKGVPVADIATGFKVSTSTVYDMRNARETKPKPVPPEEQVSAEEAAAALEKMRQ